jgi:hypothetical protein
VVLLACFAVDRNNAACKQASKLPPDLLACLHATIQKNALKPKARSRARDTHDPACVLLNSKSMGDAANAHQRNIYNKKIPTLEYVDGQVW